MMNKKVYIVSICLKKRSCGSYEFHFKGIYNGMPVNRVLVTGATFSILDEYILKANVVGYEKGDLHLECLEFKSIFNR